MSAVLAIHQHPASIDAYIRHGWAVVPIPPGTKGPRKQGWNKREAALTSQTELQPGYGIGLAHAWSGTMALDIDAWSRANEILTGEGINLQALLEAPDAVLISSGREGRAKLLYAMPFGLRLPSRKVSVDGQTAFELRCATANGLTVQDVLPPSIHPDTKQPYRWCGNGHWQRLPVLPQAVLDLWQSMLSQDQQRIESADVNASWEEIRAALTFISPDCSRDDWIAVGMALHWAGAKTGQLDAALSVWNDWSVQSDTKYPGERVIFGQWRSFRDDKTTGITLATLFHIAARGGWTRPQPDVRGLFAAVTVKEPLKVLDGLRPIAPELDMSILPAILAQRSREIADQVACDPTVPAWAGLGAVCAVANAQSRLEIAPGYQVPPLLWLMTIGAPSDKKTPGSRPMLTPLRAIEAEDAPRYARAFLEWEGREAARDAAKKVFLEHHKSVEGMLGGPAPEVPTLDPAPVPLRLTVTDITSQKLVRHCADRPEGVLCHLDEMGSWVHKLADPHTGEDRSAWVKGYDSDPYLMDRVGDGSIRAENMAVAILGNIQPRIFKASLPALSLDGLMQRFLPAILHERHSDRLGDPGAASAATAAQWEQTLRIIHALPRQVYTLDPDAYAAYRTFQTWYLQVKRDYLKLQSSDVFLETLGKMEGTVGRIALIFHLIERPFATSVSRDTMVRAIDLGMTYVIPAIRYALGEVAGSDTFDTWMLHHIATIIDQPFVTLTDIKRSGRRRLGEFTTWKQDEKIFTAMMPLESAGWVVRTDDGTREHQHYAQWAINPELMQRFASYRIERIKANQRVYDAAHEKGGGAFERRIAHGYDPASMDDACGINA